MRVPGLVYIQGRNGRAGTPKYAIAIHNTSNARLASARDEATYATRRTDGIGTHLFADRIETIQSIDTQYSCWHAGSSIGNHNAVACEIVGVNAKDRQWWIDNVNWRTLGYALAEVCKFYDIPVRRCTVAEMKKNPRIKGFYSHNDMRLAWGGTSHTDPGDNFPWDILFQSINVHMKPSAPIEGDADLTPDQDARLKRLEETVARLDQRLTTIFYGMDANTFPEDKDHVAYDNEENRLKAQLDRIEKKLGGV